MNAFYASLVAIGGSILTLFLTLRHAEKTRSMDLEHDHRERLQDRRLTAYREFDLAFTRQGRAYDRVATSSVARDLQAKRPNGTPTGRFDGEWQENLLAALQATEDLQDALAGVQLVATSTVYQQAASLLAASKEAWIIQRDLANAFGSRHEPSPDEWQRLQEAKTTVEAKYDLLHMARADELGLETDSGSGETRQRR